MKYIGIDYGSRKIGIAVSDDGGSIAFPRMIIENNADTLGFLSTLIQQEGVTRIVMGDSRDFAGNANPVMQKVYSFAEELERKTGASVYFQDERLSSVEARHLPQEGAPRGDTSRKLSAYNKAHVDSKAAAIILQSFLDKQH